MRARPALLAAAAAAPVLAAGAWLFAAGTILVRDRTGGIAGAFVVSASGERALHRLPGGYFVGLPGDEGAVELRCRDGAVEEFAYVARGLHTRVELSGPPPCRKARKGV